MRKGLFIGCLLLSALLAGCGEEAVPDTETGTFLSIDVALPLTAGTVKGNEGEAPASENENALNSLLIWVFNHASKEKVASLNVPVADFPTGGIVRRYMLQVPKSFSTDCSSVDVFVLANGASVGCNLNENSSWDAVYGANFGDPYFGVSGNNLPVSSVNPAVGLPMTATGLDLPIHGEDPAFSVSSLSLTRAVSKLRYVFCKQEGDDRNLSITKILLNGNQIPTNEYLFAEDAYRINEEDGYVSSNFTLTGPWNNDVICSNSRPEDLVYSGQTPSSYQSLLDQAIDDHVLTDGGTYYFRESDKQLAGWIYYSVDGVEQRPREFRMSAPGDFARNRTWTVYAYFITGKKIQVGVSVLPWDKNNYSVDFSEHAAQVYGGGFTVPAQAENAEIKKVTAPAGSRQDYWEVRMKRGKTVNGYLRIVSPVGGVLQVKCIQDESDIFDVTLNGVSTHQTTINPDLNNGTIDIAIRQNPDYEGTASGKTLTLEFFVDAGNDRIIDLDSEMGNHYTFILP